MQSFLSNDMMPQPEDFRNRSWTGVIPGELAYAIIFHLVLPSCAFAALVVPAIFPRSSLARILLEEVGPRPSGPHPSLRDCWICAGRWALIAGSIAVLDAGIVLALIFVEATVAGSVQTVLFIWALTFGTIFTVLGLAALVGMSRFPLKLSGGPSPCSTRSSASCPSTST